MMNPSADIIIIGSGIIGNAAAYHLTKKGHKVIVLEKSRNIGNGGSSRNGGGVRQSGRDPRELPLALYAVQNLWPHLSDELEINVEYCQKGNLRLGKTEAHLKVLEGLVQKGKAQGLGLDMISAAEARAICPYLSDEVIGAIWCPTDGHANPLRATLGYYRKARQQGAVYVSDKTVTEIRKVKGRARQVVTTTGVYEADTIVLAAGYDSRAIAHTVGIDIPMNPVLLETLVTEAMPPMFAQMLGTAAADFYGHQTEHGSFVFGGTTGLEDVINHGGVPVSTSLATSSTCRGIIAYLPALAETRVVRAWGGFIDATKDGVPVISIVEEVPGLVLAAGFTGHGFGISPAAGLLVSQLAAGEPTVLDVSAFRYDRFKART
jgi:sarcosine oxidase subunit beta